MERDRLCSSAGRCSGQGGEGRANWSGHATSLRPKRQPIRTVAGEGYPSAALPAYRPPKEKIRRAAKKVVVREECAIPSRTSQ
jgi:hypothetical protein